MDDSTKEILGKLKKLFLKFSRQIGGNTKITKCFSLLNDRDVEQFYQVALTFCTSIINSQKFFSQLFFLAPALPSAEREFLVCFFIKSISSSLSEETNKSILSLLGSLLDDELKEKYAHEIPKKAMKMGHSFSGEDGEEYSYLKPFWQEIEYSEKTEPPQINNVIPVCLLCKEITNNSLFASEWMN